MRTVITDRAKRGRRFAAMPLWLAAALLCLASCVPAPRTFKEAGEFTAGAVHRFPQCVKVSPDIEGLSFYKPAIDIGNGMVAVVTEYAGMMLDYGSVSGRIADIVDCQTGLALRFEEELVHESDATDRPQTISDDPEFRPPLERLLAGLSSSGENGSFREISAYMAANGAESKPWNYWAPQDDAPPDDVEICACKLYYPAIERHWFDERKVSPDYPKDLGRTPKNLTELEAQMTALRSRE